MEYVEICQSTSPDSYIIRVRNMGENQKTEIANK
jgi:hypothetical protein